MRRIPSIGIARHARALATVPQPAITSNGGGSTASVSVEENQTAVTTVTAIGGVTPYVFSVSGGADAAKFSINASSGVLTFAVAPDFETPEDADENNVYEVVVRAENADNASVYDQQAISVTVTNVAVENDAPTITVPSAQAVASDDTLTFSGELLISIADADTDAQTVTLSVDHGTLTLSGTTGLSFTTGDGTSDATMEFSGSLANVNAALDGLIYDPSADYSGIDTLAIGTNDGTVDAESKQVTLYVTSADIALSSPKPNQLFQRSGSTADIVIEGTYSSGSPTAIEAKWGNGAWTTIDASPSGGAFSGALSGQSAGQKLLAVRFTNDQSKLAALQMVSVGEIGVAMGQSNAVGQATNNQSYTTPANGYKLLKFDGTDWTEWADPSGSDTGGGTWYPRFGSLLADEIGCPIAIIPTAKNGSSIESWQKSELLNYNGMAVMVAAAGGEIGFGIWWQGEASADAGMSRTVYKGYLSDLNDDFFADYAAPLVVWRLENALGVLDANERQIRKAQNEAIIESDEGNGNLWPGPDLTDLSTSPDAYHPTTDEQMDYLGEVGAQAVSALYGGTSLPVVAGPVPLDMDWNTTQSVTGFVVQDRDGATLDCEIACSHGTVEVTISGTPTSGASVNFSGTPSAINTILATLEYTPEEDYSSTDDITVTVTKTGVPDAVEYVTVSVNAVVPVPDPDLQWKLDETSGTRANTGTISGSNLSDNGSVGNGNGDGVYAPSGFGTNVTVAKFGGSGSGQYLSVTSNSDVQLGDIALTIEIWVRLIGGQLVDAVVEKSGEYELFRFSSTNFFRFNGSDASGGGLTDGVWAQLVGRYNPATNTATLSVDNVHYTATIATGATNSNALEVGRFAGSWLLNGYLSHFRIWKSLLTDQQISALYNSGNGNALA